MTPSIPVGEVRLLGDRAFLIGVADAAAARALAGELADVADVADVADEVEASLEGQRVRRCMDGLTEIQRESIKLAYYGGYSYPEVAQLLEVALGTVKTRIRDGLIRMRDCMGVEW